MRISRVKDVYSGAKIVTEWVVELASERERIQRQVSALTRENKILLEELRTMRKMVVKAKQNSNESIVNDSVALVDDPNTSVTRALETITIIQEDSVTPTSTTASNQVEDTGDQNTAEEAEASSSSTPDITSENKITNKKIITRRLSKKYYTFAAIIILVLFVLAMNINWQYLASLVPQQYLGF